MSEEKVDLFKDANEILRKLHDYPNNLIVEGLANIHKRTENVIKYSGDEENKQKENPFYYRIGNIQTMHKDTTQSYYSFTKANDLGEKVVIMGKLDYMHQELVDMEKVKGVEDDE